MLRLCRAVALLALATMVIFYDQPALAQEREMPDVDKVEIVSSLWCDTAEQLETVVRAHYADKVPMGRAMAEINRDNPEACIIARAIVHPGAEVRRLTAGDTVMSLREARVHGIMRGQFAMMMRPQTWYFMRVVAELVPL